MCVGRPDCGAGIGRVTKHLLLDRFDTVDIVEQSPRLLQAAPKYVGRDSDRTTCVCVGLQVRVSTLCARCVLLFTGWAQAVPPFGGSTYARIALVPKTVSTYYCRSSSRCAFVLGAYRDRSWKLQCIGLAVLRWSWKYGGQTVLVCLTRKVLLLTTTAVPGMFLCICLVEGGLYFLSLRSIHRAGVGLPQDRRRFHWPAVDVNFVRTPPTRSIIAVGLFPARRQLRPFLDPVGGGALHRR